MSNPLKRILNPIGEADDVAFDGNIGAMPDVGYQQEMWQHCDPFSGAPRQSEYHGTTYMNPGRYENST
jgi:hypothetical protein